MLTRGRARRLALPGLAASAGLVAAWLVPAGTHRAGLDWLLPVLIWGGTAALLRTGRTVLDRLVLAAALLTGASCVAGLVISVWPWGLAPVPVARTVLSVLVVAAVALRRWPDLPLPPRTSDLPALGCGLLAAVVLLLPYRGRDLAGELALVMLGEDLARHFSLYDTIGLVGGYTFLDPARTDPYLLPGLQTYPQGSHFLYALLDSFLRSGSPAGDPLDSFRHFAGYHIAGYAFFALVTLWAARWVAGPALTGWPKIALYAFVATAVSFSELIAMVIRGYPSEILGLALFAVLLALFARPPRRARETIVLCAVLIVGIGWVYFFLLPMAGLAAVASLTGYRHRLTAHWFTAAVAAVAAVPLAVTPYLIMYTDRSDPLADLLPGGPVEGVDPALTVGLAAGLLAGLAAAPRSPVRRMVAVQLGVVGGLSLALAGYQIAAAGNLSYYFDKALHALFVTCLVGLSGLSPLLARIRGAGTGRTGWRRARELTVAALVVLGILAGYAALPLEPPRGVDGRPADGASWGLAHAAGALQNPPAGEAVAAVLRRYPRPDGRLTQVVFGGASYVCTLFVSVLHRNYGTLSRQAAAATPLYRTGDRRLTIPDVPAPRRVIVVNSPGTAERLRGILDDRPDLDVELVSLELDPS